MERYIFIHGSASGQSSLPFSEASAKICKEIGNWYFEGRENRIIGTSSPRSMFVELFKGSDGKRYCLYSFVHNECYGPAPEPRPGQYFAVTIALQESYCIHSSSIYTIFSGAYNQLIRNKIIADKIVINNKEYHNVYTIGQFKEKSAELIDFQNKIASFFDRDCLQLCRHLPSTTNLPLPWNGKPMTQIVQNRAERIPWNGETIHPSECDSIASAEKLWNNGRIYVSEEAPLASDTIQKIREEKKQLEANNKVLQAKVDNPAPNPKDKKEISSLKSEVESLRKEADRAISEKDKLQRDNQELTSTFDGLSQLISKYKGATGKQLLLIDKQLSHDAIDSKGWKKWIKTIGLLLVFVFTLVSLVLNIRFFRNFSSINDEIKTLNERIDSIGQKVDFIGRNLCNTTSFGTLPISKETVQSGADSLEQSPSKTALPSTEQKQDYGLIITDEEGNPIKKVYPDQTIKAHAKNPAQGSGWKLDGVEKTNKNDVNPIHLKVVRKNGTITIGYGDPNDKEKRQRITLNIEPAKSSTDNLQKKLQQ